jgi:hypothetical protein
MHEGRINEGRASTSDWEPADTYAKACEIVAGLDPTAFTNAGAITVSNGDTLYLGASGTTWSNTGSIAVTSGGALRLRGNFTTAQLAGISDTGGTVYIDGTLDNTGGTLNVGPGTSLSSVVLDGTITGGTIVDRGSSVHCVPTSGTIYDRESWALLRPLRWQPA